MIRPHLDFNSFVTHDLSRDSFRSYAKADETQTVLFLSQKATPTLEDKTKIASLGLHFVRDIRTQHRNHDGIDHLMQKYNLSSEEGLALMCLAEAFLRIPDPETASALIDEKIGSSTWTTSHDHETWLTGASSLALHFSSSVVKLGTSKSSLTGVVGKMLHRLSDPVMRIAVRSAMHILGNHFVFGRTIEEAHKRAINTEQLCSFDMLGESPLTDEDAVRYFNSYAHAIDTLSAHRQPNQTPFSGHGISVKLSALHPRYEFAKRECYLGVLYDRLLQLCQKASTANISLFLDAEECDRLEPSLDILEKLMSEENLKNWQGLGFVVQAYQKRAYGVLNWIQQKAHLHQKRLMLRLVKGAYWDSEIKKAQENALADYPVFTRKAHTDISYLACSRFLLQHPDQFYPCFATHNAQTVASIMTWSEDQTELEFQRLHGMGDTLATHITRLGYKCRAYAPVGSHEDLLPYLIRRLLENGANSNFVHQVALKNSDERGLVTDPVDVLQQSGGKPHSHLKKPFELYKDRLVPKGWDLTDPVQVQHLGKLVSIPEKFKATPCIHGVTDKNFEGNLKTDVIAPFDQSLALGQSTHTAPEQISKAIEIAHGYFKTWNGVSVHERALILEKTADLFEKNQAELMSLLVFEAGKTWKDTIAEVREAIDFLRFYALQGRSLMVETELPSVVGENNIARLSGRGTWLCISPWNFPLAIFIGQIAAALVTGNTVIAKSAEQTSMIGYKAVQLFYQAGLPSQALSYVIGEGKMVGDTALPDSRIKGVVFTGSTTTAFHINRMLAQRSDGIIPLIAETGGINAMIMDSSTLVEQAVRDIMTSSFQSAGQRCSALRVLLVQDTVANKTIELIKKAIDEWVVGSPAVLNTDAGSVIDKKAFDKIDSYIREQEQKGRLLYKGTVPDKEGFFIPPCLVRLNTLSELKEEIFGPVLHIIPFSYKHIDSVIEQINAMGYGLTVSLHTRFDSRWREWANKLSVGNVYVNRNQIGAIVESQPFGGQGLSGTGFKAGGQHYLLKFVTEQTLSVNLTAAGGNPTLWSMDE